MYGKLNPKIKTDQTHNLNGQFTSQLLYCGLYKFNGLNTTVDRDRVIEGSKDWMDHLN